MPDQTPLLATGLNGLVGSKLTQTFANKYSFDNLDISDPQRPIDITNYDAVMKVFTESPAEFVIHFAAFTDVTKAWEQRDDKNGIAYKVNVTGTENIVKAAAATGKHVIHISTAYVFDGEKETMYTEEDAMHPLEWYGQTKAWAEEKVTASEKPWTILRIDQPFRSDSFPKLDTAHRIIEGLKNDKLYPQFTNHYFGPTFIDDFVKVIDWVVRSHTRGIYHATAGEKWTDYDFAQLINDTLQLHKEIKKGDLNEYLKNLARPYQRNTALDCTKLKKELDFEMNTTKEAVKQIRL